MSDKTAAQKLDSSPNQEGGDIVFIRKAAKKDTRLVTSDTLLLEDEFQSLYYTPRKNTNVIIEPPFNPMVLAGLTTRNNVLQQCVTAMEVNIDGTGYEFVLLNPEEDTETGDDDDADVSGKDDQDIAHKVKKKDVPGGIPFPQDPESSDKDPDAAPILGKDTDTKPDEKKKKKSDPELDREKEMLEHFFSEPYPGMSFVTLRRKLRVDLESTGNAYLEVIRNLKGDIVFLRHLESVAMRIVKLDAPVDVEVKVMRGGDEVTATIPMRERRYCYKVGANLVYYRDFGTSRQINKSTGAWFDDSDKAKADTSKLGSEVIHFTVNKDFRTRYGLPRWINQLPSVLGSRKAEEYNLEFFDAGGLPPAIIFVQGGALVGGVKEQLEHYLSGKASQKHRAAIVEVTATSGSLDAAGSVKVTTERFGASTTDLMFEKYDNQTKEHVRMSFRLAPILIGAAQDYNLATSLSSLKACESQVFQPERFEFDEIINNTIIKGLGAKRYVMRSKGTSFADATIQIQAMQYASQKLGGEELVKTLNEITGLAMEYDEDEDPAQQQQQPSPFGDDFQGGADLPDGFDKTGDQNDYQAQYKDPTQGLQNGSEGSALSNPPPVGQGRISP